MQLLAAASHLHINVDVERLLSLGAESNDEAVALAAVADEAQKLRDNELKTLATYFSNVMGGYSPDGRKKLA